VALAGRFMAAGADGLLRDKTRPSRIPPLGMPVAERAVPLRLSDPPAETTHWTSAALAEAAGISPSSVQRIGRSHGLQPHRVRSRSSLLRRVGRHSKNNIVTLEEWRAPWRHQGRGTRR
jgi:hypothetical protein